MATIEAQPRRSTVTEPEKLRGLKWRIAFAACNSVFCTLTVFGYVFPLFLDRLGLAKSEIGFVQSLAPFSGMLALVVAPWVARFGYKRTFVTFWVTRKFVIALLLLAPWVAVHSSHRTTLAAVSACVLGFAICRAFCDTAFYPWTQEAVPNSMRGKVQSLSTIASSALLAVVLPLATWIISGKTTLLPYQIVIAIGIAFGFGSAFCVSMCPGGAPARSSRSFMTFLHEMIETLHDANFRRFLFGLGLVMFAQLYGFSFLPLFLKEEAGLSDSAIIGLQIAAMVIVWSSYLWGWAADRFGSKPVMLLGVLGVACMPPLWWLAMPRHHSLSMAAAVALVILGTFLVYAWNAGYLRELFVSVVPSDRSTPYMAVYCGWYSLVSGLAPLAAGITLDAAKGVAEHHPTLLPDPYAAVLFGSVPFAVAGFFLLRRVKSDSAMSASAFARMFFQGNPFTALGALVRYNFAGDEDARVTVMESLGGARSPLNVQEMIEALEDPSFNVRYEAIVSMARTRPDPQLTEALLSVVQGNEPDLSVAAAWALGRLGDTQAVPALRQALFSDYPLLQTRAARALATLGDAASIPRILERFREEADSGERMAYASALGRLRCAEALPELLAFLDALDEANPRNELALAIAHLCKCDRVFIRLWRETREDAGTALSQAVFALARRARRHGEASFSQSLSDCSTALAGEGLESGCAALAQAIGACPSTLPTKPGRRVLPACAEALNASGPLRIEYALLAVAILTRRLRRAGTA